MQRSQSSNIDKTVLSSTERLVASKQVQKAQHMENDKVMLSGTERLVTLKHEESEDPTLIHKPHDEANERLKTKVLENISRNFDGPRFARSQSAKHSGECS